MKKIIVLMMLGILSPAMAYDIRGNPDRRPSLGFNYINSVDKSEYMFGDFRIADFSKQTGNTVLLDARIPLSRFFTLTLRGGLSRSDNDIFTGEKVEWSGHNIGFGIRLYLP